MLRKTLALSTALCAVTLIATLDATPGTAAPRVVVPDFATSPIQLAAYDPLVYRAQVALSARGFDVGSADGKFGPRTRAAIQAYQRQTGQAATGSLNENLVAQLENGGAVRADRSVRDDRSVEQRRTGERRGRLPQAELISRTQAELRRHGYDITFIGGRLNGETSDAISDYQRTRGLDSTGMPSEQLLATMQRDNVNVGGRAIQPAQPSSNYPVQTYPAPSYPSSGPYQVAPAQPVECADFLHQGRPGGSDYQGPPVPGCTN